jgi:hypothetical protein
MDGKGEMRCGDCNAIRNMANIDVWRYIDGIRLANDVIAILDMVNIAI